MDNLTHTLTGIALSQAGLNRKTRYASLALIVGSNLPDLDIVTRLAGSATYLKYHRGYSHSIPGAVVLAAVLAGIIQCVGGRAALPKKSAPPLNAAWLLAVCWIATASHILMDFTNAYGIRPFLPFSGRWYAWDIMFVFDPLLLAVLMAGLGTPLIFRLVSEEVGARKPGFRRGAVLALCGLMLLWGWRDFARRRVMTQLDSHTYGEENPLRVDAFPTPVNPFDWFGVVETESAYRTLEANALDPDVDVEHTRIFHKPQSSPPLDAAWRTRTAGIFADFARYPWAHMEETEDGFRVTIQDLRFGPPRARRPPFIVKIDLDKNLRARAESFSFVGGED